MPATVYLVTGGCRSGKSRYAESICTQLCPNPIYVATAAHSKLTSGGDLQDDDFARRIQRHQNDRANQNWTTIEEPLLPSRHADRFSGKAVLIDCLTVWLTNYLLEEGALDDATIGIPPKSEAQDSRQQQQQQRQQTEACHRALTRLQQEFETLIQPYDVTFVLVTNEVGSAIHAASHIARKFVEYQGWLNQFAARHAQQVIHMVCGQPTVIKNDLGEGNVQLWNTNAMPSSLLAQRLDRHLSTRRLPMDSKGYFIIKTDTTQCLIIASFHSCILNPLGEVCDLEGNKIDCDEGTGNESSQPEPMKVWMCRTAKELTTEIFERWEFLDKAALSVGHAAYIGREAQRAEHCLYQSGLAYQQD